MKWNKISIETTTQAEDMLSYELQEMGIEGVEIVDHVPLTEEERKIMYVDLLPETNAPDDGTAKIICYLDERENLAETTEKIRAKIQELSAFLPMGTGKITFDVTEEEDWMNNWKAYFKPFRVDDTIVIKPSWEEVPDLRDGDVLIEIDPGTAFGSGSHETTKLCILELKKQMRRGAVLLDVGTGSGILTIAGLKLGAARARATDIDPNAIRAAKENFARNGIGEQEAQVTLCNLLDEEEAERFLNTHPEKYDIITANILADVIIPLSAVVKPLLTADGLFIASGILDTMEEAVREAMTKGGWEILSSRRMKDWVSLTARPKKG